jgi:hypothetical protein
MISEHNPIVSRKWEARNKAYYGNDALPFNAL